MVGEEPSILLEDSLGFIYGYISEREYREMQARYWYMKWLYLGYLLSGALLGLLSYFLRGH